ncbi:MAG: DNA polymerase I [Planctomycetota bacterium]
MSASKKKTDKAGELYEDPKRVYLIDGTALAYRAHFAFAATNRGGLTNREGKSTSAAFGFTSTLRSLMQREKPDYCAVAFDGPISDLERTRVYSEYKATREDAPEELVEQFDVIREISEAHGLPILESKGHEADDCIGTMARQAREAGCEVFLVTSDKDFMQLVDDQLKMWNLRSSTSAPEVQGPAEVREKFGVEPEQMIDMLALMGDSSDNVPGVPRVGQKTAAKLLGEWKSLDGIYENLDDVKPPGIQKTLRENKDQAYLSQQLVTIQLDVPMTVSFSDLEEPEPDVERLRELFKDLDFDALLKTLPKPKGPTVDQHYRTIRNQADLDDLLAILREHGRFALDTETTSIEALDADLVGISVSWAEGKAAYIPFNLEPPVVDGGPEKILEAVRSVLEDESLKKTLQNAKYDLVVFRRAGVEVRGVQFDTMLASYLIGPGIQKHNLDDLSLQYFDHQKIPTKELLGTGKKAITFDQVDIDKAAEYASEDADFTWRLRVAMEPQLEELKLRQLHDELELPLVPVLMACEGEGIRLDLDHLSALSKELERRIEELVERIYERAGEPFNLNSPAQIGTVLFDRLEVHLAAKMKPKKTKTGQWKTDATVLEKLATVHEVPQAILDYRQLTKLKSTYVDSLPELVREDTGRIHTSFNQAVAATGRLSSDHPNLQNIPIRTEWGRKVRRAFIARDKGWKLLSADYSQIELRILAHLSGDEGLKNAFLRGDDIHTDTAARVHGMVPDLVTPDIRSQAKVINYGIVYGMGASRLARETGMSVFEAKKFIDNYFRAFPGVKSYLDETLAFAQEHKYVETFFGRRRPLPDIDASAAPLRVAAENMAVNTPIQGTAADIIKRAMLTVHQELNERGLNSRMLLQVHDELVLDVLEDELAVVEPLVREAMQGAAVLDVPLEVGLGVADNWLDAH